jgi:cell division protein FtsW (lipid II flippase)
MSARPARRRPTRLAVVYLLLAAVGLVMTWSANIRVMTEGRDFLADLSAGGPAVSSLSWDLLIAAVASVVFIIVEGRRLRMRHVWAYLVLVPLVAFAVALPLFLAAREMRVTARDRADATASPNPTDRADAPDRADATASPDPTSGA